MSRKRLLVQLEQPPVEIIRGAQMIAEYLPQEVSQFRDNPLSEAIPRTLTPGEVTEYLLQLPSYSHKDRELSQVARLQMAETAREFFVPNGKHLTVYYAVTNMIHRGYVRRNPVLWGYWKQVHNDIESFLRAIKDKPFPNSRARGLALVGSGGTGKSTTMEKILQSIPQVIIHVSYRNQDFIMKQLVWLKLDCPRGGSLREFCVNFFRAVDEILGTDYEKHYAGSSRRTLEDLIAGMARVAANQCLGLLVIDEIQDLSRARSGGDISMINFLVHLENKIGVPFALIGTQGALSLLSGQFRQLRRVSEQGFITWDRMSEVEPEIEDFDEDDGYELIGETVASATTPPSKSERDTQKKVPRPDVVWKNFVETLWMYQYVKHLSPLNENIVQDRRAHTLYAVAKGIPAVVQTVFVLTQQRAILTGEEKITSRLIRETVRENQKLIEEMLGETRMRRPQEASLPEDLADMGSVYEAEYCPIAPPASVNVIATTNQIIAEGESGGDAGGNAQSEQKGPVTKPPAKRNAPRSGRNANNLGQKAVTKHAAVSKNAPRSPTSRVKGQTESRSHLKKNKYSRSAAEYLKEK